LGVRGPSVIVFIQNPSPVVRAKPPIAAAVAIVDDFEQVTALLRGQRRQPPVVENQKLDTGEGLEEAYIAPIAACERKCVE
jgi:hypothetical protein